MRKVRTRDLYHLLCLIPHTDLQHFVFSDTIIEDEYYQPFLKSLTTLTKKANVKVEISDPSIFGSEPRFQSCPYYEGINVGKLKYLSVDGKDMENISPEDFPKVTHLTIVNYQSPRKTLFITCLRLSGIFNTDRFDPKHYPCLKYLSIQRDCMVKCDTSFSLPKSLIDFECETLLDDEVMENVRDTLIKSSVSGYKVPNMRYIDASESTSLLIGNDTKFTRNKIRNRTLETILKNKDKLEKKRNTMKLAQSD
jgi:hypothetical protein